MAQTKFFTKKSDNLEDYKNNFKKALQKVKVVKLFNDEIINFLQNWIEPQKSYIPREDIDNFLENMNFLFENKDFYDFILKELKNVKNNGNLLEYSFNLISKLDDSKKDFEKILDKKIREEKLKKDLKEAKNQDLEKIKKLENLFDEM